MNESNEIKFNTALVTSLLFLPPIACYSLQLPHADVISIFITIIGLWLTEAVPLPVSGLLVPVLAVLHGVLPTAKAFESFGSDIIFLFLGCFIMSRSIEKNGFDKRIAYFLLGRCMPGTSFFSINLVIALTSFILSMWISNTSATAILTTVTLGILSSLDSQLKDAETKHKASVRLLLSCAFAASIGGLATPVGSPPNLIALKFLSQKGINISFAEWFSIGLPVSIFMLAVLLIFFEILFPLKKLSFPGIKEQFRGLSKELGPMKAGEIEIAIIFFATVLLWVLPGVLISIFPDSSLIQTLNSRFSMSVVGMIGGLASFFLPVYVNRGKTPNLFWQETDKIDWGTLMLFGGGLTLGLILEQSGTAADVSKYFFSSGESQNLIVLGLLVVVLSIIMSEFASNTAAASILIPLIIAAMQAKGVSLDVTKHIVLAATFGASFGFMLPVSTPPNAIVYGTGRVPAADMRKTGIFFDISGALIIIFYFLLVR